MKKYFILLFVICLAIPGFAKLKKEDLVGKWKFEVKAGEKKLDGSMEFELKDEKLQGKYLINDGNKMKFTKIELKDNDFLFLEIKTTGELYKVTVKVTGNSFIGNASYNQEQGTIKGEKEKEEKE